MENKPFVNPAQILCMSVGSALVFPYTFMPILSAPPANQDAWIVLLITGVYLVLLDIPLLFIINKCRGLNANETAETILGKFFGKIAAVIFTAFFAYCYMACLLITATFISLYLFPETPTWALLLYMAVPVSYAAWKGAGVIGRIATLLIPFVILTVILFFGLGIDDMDLRILQPVLADSTFFQLNQGAFLTGARYSEILIFFVFSFFLPQKSSVNKTYFVSVSVFVALFFLMLLPTLTVLGPELAKHAWNPYFVFTRQIEGYDFIERVQSLNTLAWFPTALLKLTLYNYMGSYVLAGVFKAKSHKGFVIPISVLGSSLCLLPIINKSCTIEVLRSDQVFPFVVLPVTFLVPLIMMIVYFFRRDKVKAALAQKKATQPPQE